MELNFAEDIIELVLQQLFAELNFAEDIKELVLFAGLIFAHWQVP